MGTHSVAPFSPTDDAARLVKNMLVAILILVTINMLSELLDLKLISLMTSGRRFIHTARNATAVTQLVTRVLMCFALIIAAVRFLTWVHRSHKNLPSLSARQLKYTPGWAVGWFFVPFLNFVRPIQVMREIWHGSDPARLESDLAPPASSVRNVRDTPPLIGWWWGLFLASHFVGAIVSLAHFHPGSLDELRFMIGLMFFIDALAVASVFLALRLIGRITTWQTERADTLRQRSAESHPVAARNAGTATA